MTLREQLLEIKGLAEKYYSYRNSDHELMYKINNLTADEFNAIKDMYKGAAIDQPVNFLRSKILNRIASDTLTKEWLDIQKEDIVSKTKKSSFNSFSNFSILFPFLRRIHKKINVKAILNSLGTTIIDRLKIKDFVNTPHIVDFSGPRKFGSERVWMAIYNSSHKNQTTAKQFFFHINKDGFIISFYDYYNDKGLGQLKINLDENILENIVSFFANYTDDLKANLYGKLQSRTLGVKGCNVYKLSYGKDFFTFDEVQNCITNELAVMHEQTGAKGRSSFTQYETFKGAKKGDVFYGTWGNDRLVLVGQFMDDGIFPYEAVDMDKKHWKARQCKILYKPIIDSNYKGNRYWWAPSNNSTFIQIYPTDFEEANKGLFTPFFKVSLDNTIPFSLPEVKNSIGVDKDVVVSDAKVDPTLDINLIGKEFARLIRNLESEKGQFLGIFGRWGRGKTFFAQQIFEFLERTETKEKESYKPITFNAWKYQDSNAIWSYIYETFKKEYLSLSNEKWYKRLILILKLNKARKGNSTLWYYGISLVSVLIWMLLVINPKFDPHDWYTLAVIVVNLGILASGSIEKLYTKYVAKSKEVYKEYLVPHDYKSELGLQAEIQEEIKTLFKVWFDLKTTRNRWRLRFIKWNRPYEKLLFFVDDIDRCNEDKIIQVVDSLRVMLEDEDIIDRMVIIAAIDETILKTAIEWKYKDFLSFTDAEGKAQKRNLEITTREYMDKLFIGGLKLPKLLAEEQYIILKNYADKAKILEDDSIQNIINIEENTASETITKDDEDETNEFVYPESIYKDHIEEEKYFLLKSELNYLHQALKNNIITEITPRQLRIYLNRYLLAKNIASSFLERETGTKKLSEEYTNFIIDSIILKTNNLKEEIKVAHLEVDEKLKVFTPKLINMIVPY